MFDKPETRHRFSVTQGFICREDGNMIMLGMMFFTLMVMMGGMAVDLMRYEERRTELQQTADRAVLAAASLRQTLDPTTVVDDYFLKAGLSDKLESITSARSDNDKLVAVTAVSDVEPFFMHMMGIEDLPAPAAATALQRITDVEISLVLDVSGSMLTNNKIGGLRTAAKEFVDTVLQASEEDRTTISIIPYNMQVNLGDTMSSVFNMPRHHTLSFCADLPASSFSSTTVSQTTELFQSAALDWPPISGVKTPESATHASTFGYYPCPAPVGITVTPMSDDRAYLKARIDALQAGGNTSIDIGMKWGVTLLDPASRGIVTSLVDKGAVSNRFLGRPLDPADRDVLKVVVLMTDGQNTDQVAVKPEYRSGLSNIYRQNSNGNLAFFDNRPGVTNPYYMPDNAGHDRRKDKPFGSPNGWTQLTWPEVWANAKLYYVAEKLFGEARGESAMGWFFNIVDVSDPNAKNTRLSTICTAAKAKGIVVFGIGFADSAHTPVPGRPHILACSTAPAYYYDVTGVQISTAFRSIASQITKLRLTQ